MHNMYSHMQTFVHEFRMCIQCINCVQNNITFFGLSYRTLICKYGTGIHVQVSSGTSCSIQCFTVNSISHGVVALRRVS